MNENLLYTPICLYIVYKDHWKTVQVISNKSNAKNRHIYFLFISLTFFGILAKLVSNDFTIYSFHKLYYYY